MLKTSMNQTTQLATTMTTELTIQDAIARSQSHDEIVAVTIEAADIAEAMSEIHAAYDGADTDYTDTNDNGVYDVWGWTEEQEGTDKTDFRLLVTIRK